MSARRSSSLLQLPAAATDTHRPPNGDAHRYERRPSHQRQPPTHMTSMSTYRPMREVHKDDVDKRGTAATHTRLPMSGRSRVPWPMRELRGEHVIESNQWEEESGVTSHVSFPAPSCHDQYCPTKERHWASNSGVAPHHLHLRHCLPQGAAGLTQYCA